MKPDGLSNDGHVYVMNLEFKLRPPIKLSRGKCVVKQSFLFSVIFFLGFTLIHGYSERVAAVVAIPLGSQLYGNGNSSWASENGVFEFGFFSDSQSNGLVVGIWYNMIPISGKMLVWSVGGGTRVSENSIIRLSMDGNLVLLDNTDGFLVWSSNTSGLGVKFAGLMNNGDLVLTGSGREIVWESFQSPTDTLLPGQSLEFHQTLRAAMKNSIASYYTLKFQSTGNLGLSWENNVTYWSSNLQAPVASIGAKFGFDGVFQLLDSSREVVWARMSKDFREPLVKFRFLRLDIDGNLRIYSWEGNSLQWKVGWQAVEDQCHVFGFCGLYGVCSYNNSRPICTCPFEDSNIWGIVSGVDAGSGCRKMVDLSRCREGKGMVVLKQTMLYGLYPPHDIETMASSESCKEKCLSDSSCFAATSKNDGSGLCTIKRTSFISGYRYSSVTATSFVKVCLVPQAVSSQEAMTHHPSKPLLAPEQQLQEPMSHLRNQKNFLISVAELVLVTVCVFLVIEMLVFWFLYRIRAIKVQKRIPFQKVELGDSGYSAPIGLSFDELKELTSNFAIQLGPTVYKGVLPNQRPIIVKVLETVALPEKDFRMAVSILCSTHHRNLVPVKGFCFEPRHQLVLYEYVENGSLDQWLFDKEKTQNSLTWQQRIDIAIGIARAISYLHLECKECIAHGNLKLENVLLDVQLVARVTDFGIKSLLNKEHAFVSESLPERDVYMFGGMLLQIITGKRGPIGMEFYSSILEMYRNGELDKLMDVRMEGTVDWEEVERAISIAFWCLHHQPFLRPSISEVVKVLEGTFSVDSPPSPCSLVKVEDEHMKIGDSDTVEEVTFLSLP
ncbi:G-type lectin S-receptor-like serine/threonine-protein kinase SD3-1 [Amborella trichopoda]|uniref:Receptor-like serine/threonine-protein kinase n=1 Tax=Amborella trichopoda TaxID=13333 RepID=U5D4B7_AMBTC|nr:G-type lectin S-receptor-like serine/threonine-protein kinase SD3-1 [Amborella trichopoda]ERN20456.1 hypothetical protein AMTR_s00068p00132090 [Amborella trichopoda]|eukprot:XP_006858989.1 G-type lectin S-receptor-like serine/threonine-protein kinase SD3-1 [Amborella trichopoda]